MKEHLFAKLFSNPKYKEDFLNGKIYMCSLGYFKDLELTQGTKGDPLEGIGSYLQSNQVEIDIEYKGERHRVTGATGAITFENHGYRYLKVFCLYSPELDLTNTNGVLNNIQPTEEMIKDFGRELIWIYNVSEFKRRIETALKKNENIKKYEYRHVEYYSDNHHGIFTDSDIPFKKHEKFVFQKEFRIVLKTNDESTSSFVLNIGDIRDICIEMRSADFNEGEFKIEINEQKN